MEEQNEAFQFKEVSPEERELLNTLYGSNSGHLQSKRVGPKGYILTNEYKKYVADIYNMGLKDGDIFVTSYQRSGTTWTQELVWLVARDLDYKTAEMVTLTQRYAFLEKVSFLNDEHKQEVMEQSDNNEQLRQMMKLYSTPDTEKLATTTCPRFIKTHLPMSFLPPKLLDTAKVVYVARDPRDVMVSCYHHAKLFTRVKFKGSFKDLWKSFLKDLFMVTPYFEHVKEAWAMRDHPNMLFLFYENLSKDLPASIRRVADFLGKELTQEQIERLCDHLSIDNFKKNNSVNFEEIRKFGFLDSNETFIRKGKTGGWQEYFDEGMQRDTERWIADNLRDTDLRFPSMAMC